MKIIIDADSCPREIRAIIGRAGKKHNIAIMFIANTELPGLDVVKVPDGEGEADRFIIESAGKEDLVITRDIPLAAELVEHGITVINDRGEKFTKGIVKERLSVRNHMKNLRDTGLAPELRGKRYGDGEKKKFADTFSRELTRLLKFMIFP